MWGHRPVGAFDAEYSTNAHHGADAFLCRAWSPATRSKSPLFPPSRDSCIGPVRAGYRQCHDHSTGAVLFTRRGMSAVMWFIQSHGDIHVIALRSTRLTETSSGHRNLGKGSIMDPFSPPQTRPLSHCGWGSMETDPGRAGERS